VIPTLWWNDDFINIDICIPYEQALSEMALAGYVGFVSLASSQSVRSAQRMPVFVQCREFRMSRPLRKHMAASVKVTLA
ncbi:hypothetical protein ACC677_38460, partial [Rhizobium ruizarguesonis]